MAEVKGKLQSDIANKQTYLEKTSAAFKTEMALFERFFESISHHAKTHRQITLNNLEEVEDRLKKLKTQAEALKDSIFFHEETVIVDRQEIIAQTEARVHDSNYLLLDYDIAHADDLVDTLDYLNKALIKVKFDFFDTFQKTYLDVIDNNEDYFAYIEQKSTEFQEVLKRHQEEVLSIFLSLNDEITHMDDGITEIIKKKNETINNLDTFFTREMKHYIDNQLMFSPVADPTSIDIQALVSDKIVQFNTFRKHLEKQNVDMIAHLKHKYRYLSREIKTKLLEQKSQELTGRDDFFIDPVLNLAALKQQLLEAEANGNVRLVNQLASAFVEFRDHESLAVSAEIKANQLAKRQRLLLNRMLREYLIESAKTMNDLERTLTLYQQLMDYDTFLAQAIGDDSTKIIKVELDHLAILAMNKELRLNIDFDINSLSIKTKINEVENKLIYQVKKQILLQEVELLELIAEIQAFILERKAKVYLARTAIYRERILIDRLEAAMNYHLEYLHHAAAISRRWNCEILELLITDIRSKETYNIHVAEAASKIKLGLKEYDMKALHFRTMFENELSYLVMQSSRVQEETTIHNEFVLTTLENQMRFAKEQIELADNEYRLRVEAIIKAVDEEKSYFLGVIENSELKYHKRQKLLENEYLASLYKSSHLLEETSDLKIHKLLAKDLEKLKKDFEIAQIAILEELERDHTIIQTKRRLRELHSHLDDALKDASVLKDETIAEMNELYWYAKERYEVLKPYLKQKVNILDPAFYNGLESVNKRFRYKLKVAEIELDEATSKLLEEYVKIYFTEMPETDVTAFKAKIDELTTLRDTARTAYAEKMGRLEAAVQEELESYRLDSDKAETEKLSLLDQIRTMRDQTLANLKQELDQTDAANIQMVSATAMQHEQLVKSLTEEFEKGMKSSHRFREAIAEEFAKLMNSYLPYIKVAKRNPDIRDTFRFVNREAARKLRLEIKSIVRKSRKTPFI